MKHTTRAKLVILGGVALLARRRMLDWGATRSETQAPLPGDEWLPGANLVATRAISIAASPAAAWQWLVQIGQGRGGFYSYDILENVAGCNIHSANELHPDWQHLNAGDEIRLHPKGGLSVASVNPGKSLVLRGGAPIGVGAPPFDFTWSFVLDEVESGATRLVVRERYAYQTWWAPFLVEPVAVMSFVMSQKMMRGIRDRAERMESQ